MSVSGIVKADALTADASLGLEERMVQIMNGVSMAAWTARGTPQEGELYALETNHVTGGRSAQSALKQRELIGVLAANAWHYGSDIIRIAPLSAKKALTGSGKASKERMVEAMSKYHGAPEGLSKAKREAVADALGIVLAGVAKWEESHSEPA